MRTILVAAAFLTISFSAFAEPFAESKEPVKILDISSYSLGASFANPVRDSLRMRADELNSTGGLLGRPVEIIHVDDTGSPDKAIEKLEALVAQEKPFVITGCNLANIELAISAWTKKNKVLQVSACLNSDDAMWKEYNPYMFRGSGPLVYGLNWRLAERASVRGKLKWAAVNHNYAWGQDNLKAFKENLQRYQPEVTWVEEQWVPIGKIDAGSVVNAIKRSGAEAVYTALWGSDLVEFLRQAKKRGLTDTALIVGDNLGRPEFREQNAKDIPVGAITYATLPFEDPQTPEMKSYAENYQKKYGVAVRSTGMLAYITMQTIEAAVKKAGSFETERLRNVLPRLEYDTIVGKVIMRAIDHVPTNGVWIAETDLEDNKPVLINVEYKDGKNYFPADEKIKELRK